MFTLLAPLALTALALLAIPTAIHLLKPKRVRTMPFSSLRWLRTSQHKLSRRIQWHQVLLFLLRAAFLAALVLALSKPVFSSRGDRLATDRFVVLDVSRSMRYEEPGGETPFARGREIARALLDGGAPGDRATVVLAANRATALGPLSEDPTRYLAPLEAAAAGLGETDLSSALAVIRPMLSAPRPGSRAELIFITDHQQGAWSQGAVAAFQEGLPLPATVRVIDVGAPAARNAWIADARVAEIAGKKFLQVRVGASGNEPLERTLKVTQPPELGALVQKATIAPSGLGDLTLPLPADFNSTGKLAELVLEPRDALPEDDHFWLNLDERGAARVLLLEPASTLPETLQPGFHLRTALAALGRGESPMQLTRRTPEAVAAADFKTANVVVMVNVAQLSDDRVLALENAVRGGAGLLVFLGPAVQPPFYNTKLHHANRPADSLLPRALLQITRAELAGLTDIAWTHPLLAPLFDPAFGDLPRTRARTFYRFAETLPGDESNVLARFEQTAPAVIEHGVALGRVLIFNGTANDEWWDLPRRNSFVPLLDQALRRLTPVRQSGDFQAGETVALALPALGENTQAVITTPSGRQLTPAIQHVRGQLTTRLERADETGVYSVRATGATGSADLRFVVRVGRGDSNVAKTPVETVRAWWGAVPFEVTHADPAAPPDRAAGVARVLLWPWLLGLAALVLLAEMYFVHRLCPVMNPAAATSSVARQGIFAPTSTAEAAR